MGPAAKVGWDAPHLSRRPFFAFRRDRCNLRSIYAQEDTVHPSNAERALIVASLLLILVTLTIGSAQFFLRVETLR
jgi:hypothetical protein